MASASTFMLFIRLIFSLAVVIGLMWIAANVLRKRGLISGSGTARRNGPRVDIELVARRPLGRNSSIAVIRVGERAMVVGVTENSVTKLDDTDLPEIDLNEAGANWTAPQGTSSLGSAWKTVLEQMRNRTARR
jgi:flagellar protein FliO/FliZ